MEILFLSLKRENAFQICGKMALSKEKTPGGVRKTFESRGRNGERKEEAVY